MEPLRAIDVSDLTIPVLPIDSEAFEAHLALPQNSERRFELIHGVIVEKMPSLFHNLIAGILFVALWVFNRDHELGEVVYETRFRANPDDRENDRLPDISFTRKARLLPVPKRGAVPQIPDLCIEIQSPDDYPKMMRDKAAYYLGNGAQQVWLIFTKKPLIEVMYPDGQSEFFYPGDILTGGDLLPGFAIAVDEIFKVRQ
jgi:Uma2 family endonuclease